MEIQVRRRSAISSSNTGSLQEGKKYTLNVAKLQISHCLCRRQLAS